MSISAAIVLFAVVWFMTLFVILPLRLQSQAEAGEVVAGTPASAPVNPNLKRKAIITTIVAVIIWLPICLVINSGVITMDMFAFYNVIE